MAMELCDDTKMAKLVEALGGDDTDDLISVEAVLVDFPQDARLHFMRGSVLAGQQQHVLAHEAMSKAIELAPDFHIARYQLGFFELTSGEADQALSTLAPLLRLPTDNYLRNFVEGLTHLIRDEFEDAIRCMQDGMTKNLENEPMNNDIRLLITECKNAAQNQNGGDHNNASDTSATSILLGQFDGKPN